MLLIPTLLFIAGLVLLVAGAEVLVRGASRLAVAVGISPLVVGLTVVAYGTSAPELAVSIQASLAGQPDVAVGNVVGSNIANILLILGLSALVAPLIVAQQLVRIDVPLMIGVSLLLLGMAYDGRVGRLEGGILVVGAIAYTLFAIIRSRKESRSVQQEYEDEFGPREPSSVWLDAGLILAGLALLVVGARWLVNSATVFATALGVSELVIGLTVVAIGTSLPELATSVVAAIKGERDIAVGNVVGSNIFNILLVLGGASLFARDGMRVAPAVLSFDLPVMIAVAVACLPIFFNGLIDRWEGGFFLIYFAAYTTYLFLKATQHDALPLLSGVMLWFVFPITAVTLGVLALRRWQKAQQESQ
ncbi:MAG TPA: calcium/sodium antiporter [Thermoanaerobaculia bacterium]|nr:calcium/sodium antiporter [Thermoanaerobaculia bacterium]